ncbi:MAG: hypothetical protein ACI82A_002524 [Candidatus Azotimanducaceae bacterium]|jgi:hypothetical protein
MTWDAVGAIAEALSAVAVLATLIYLSIQVRQNTNSMDETRRVELARNRTQTQQMRAEWMLAEASSPELMETYAKLYDSGWPDPKCLDVISQKERLIIVRLQFVNRMINENAEYQFEAGLIDEATFEPSRRVIISMSPLWNELSDRSPFPKRTEGDA